MLVHSLTRSFAHVVHEPYRALFDALAAGGHGGARRSRGCGGQRRPGARGVPRRAAPAIRSCRMRTGPAASPRSSRLGRVVAAESRDAAAARTLGFVPSHSVSSALEMAHGVAGGRGRVGVLLAPPYAPLLVGRPTPSPRYVLRTCSFVLSSGAGPSSDDAARSRARSRDRRRRAPSARSARRGGSGVPCLLISTIVSKIRSTKIGASPIDGSSSISSFGRAISARPIAHICCSPPDIVPAFCVRRSREPREEREDPLHVLLDLRRGRSAGRRPSRGSR